MQDLLIYIFKASALLGIFYLSYFFMLKKETSFELNRKFLVAGLLSSFILPLIYFTRRIYVEAQSATLQYIPNDLDTTYIVEETSTNWWFVGGILYLGVSGFFLLRLLFQLHAVFKTILSGNIKKQSGFRYLETQEDQLPFSFFNFIVFSIPLRN